MDIALKQRLVGASVLIALAVVILPMLLGGRPEEGAQEAQTIELPPKPSELDFQTRRYPVGETPAVTPRAALETMPGAVPESLPQPSPQSSTEGDTGPGALAHVEVEPRAFEDALPGENAPAVDTSAGPANEPQPVEQTEPPPQSKSVAAPAAVDGGRYVVQVASFGSTGNAKRLAETLRDSGYAVLTDKVSSDVGSLHRVRVGPYASETEAKAAVTRLRQQFSDVKPRVVDLQPERAAQVSTPSDPLVRWVVQLGSFSSSANAEKLVERARAEGFSAYEEEISSSGTTIHRVRVGPFLERDEAIRVDGLIAERLSLDGVVMSAD
jgi:DedD protein